MGAAAPGVQGRLFHRTGLPGNGRTTCTGIAEVIDADIAALKVLARLAKDVIPGVDLAPIVSELAIALTAVLVLASPARAEMLGHVTFGYGKLFVEDAPGGSFAVSGGLDWPVVSAWRLGFDVGYSLLGSNNVQRGSLFANIDYSALSAYAVGIWQPGGLGPLERVTLGGGIMSGQAEIAAAGGGAAFRDLAREGVVPGALLSATLMSSSPAPLRAGLEFDALFVTALLTVIGFSVHDTIVVFDRIREEWRATPTGDFRAISNSAVLNTLPRSVNTGLSTLFILAALLFLGGESLSDFALALVIGIAVGTYSSNFTATPITIELEQRWPTPPPAPKEKKRETRSREDPNYGAVV